MDWWENENLARAFGQWRNDVPAILAGTWQAPRRHAVLSEEEAFPGASRSVRKKRRQVPTWKLREIAARRRAVAERRAVDIPNKVIAAELKVSLATVNDDIRALRECGVLKDRAPGFSPRPVERDLVGGGETPAPPPASFSETQQ